MAVDSPPAPGVEQEFWSVQRAPSTEVGQSGPKASNLSARIGGHLSTRATNEH